MAKLFVAERRNKIMEILHKEQRITVKELSDKMSVSEATLRIDLNKMEQEGLLKRTHGGAVLNDLVENETTFSVREKRNRDAKSLIAQEALSFIQDGSCILLDASSTALELARLLKDESIKVTVVTSGIYTALELRDNPDITVILTGGVLSRESSSLEGMFGATVLDQINVDYMFTSANGFSFDTGLTDFNVYEIDLKKRMVEKSRSVIALIDQSKINKISIASFANADEIHAFITDHKPDEELLHQFEKHNITLITTSKGK